MVSHTNNSVDEREKLAEYICNLEFDDIPEEVVDLEKQHILDTLGCILYGTTTPWVNNYVKSFDHQNHHDEASVIGQEFTTVPSTAILLNGAASHSMDYDDYALDGGIHAGASVIPPALAYSETQRNIDGKEFLTAITAGVEAGIRIGIGFGRGLGDTGVHIGGWTGPVAAAATTGKLLDLDSDQMAEAISISLTLGSGLLGAARGASVKRFHMGRAAESGFLAAHLAENSVEGDPDVLKKRWGSVYALAGDTLRPEKIVENIGEEYAIDEMLCFKPFPSVGTIHPSVTALDRIIDENNINNEDIEEITVYVHQQVNDKIGWEYEPEDVMSAQGSLKYALSAYLENNQLSISDYTEEAIKRSEVVKRTEDILVKTDNELVDGDYDFLSGSPYKRTRRLRMEVTTESGDEYSRLGEVPKGWPENRMTPSETREKFRGCANGVLNDEDIDKIENQVYDMENVEGVNRIAELLR